MSGYTEFARTNIIELKDIEAFTKMLEAYEIDHYIRVVTQDKDAPNMVVIVFDEGLPPSFDLDSLENVTEEMTEKNYDDVFDLITEQLTDGSLCIVKGAYVEGSRDCGGFAFAFDNTGESVSINTESIYDLAEKHFVTP